MTPTPEVKPLPHLQRKIIFICSLLIFVTMVPLLVFYAIGYRFDFSGEVTNIKSVGGVYVTSEVSSIEMYIDDEPVEDMRIFQNAAYIQNLEADLHQVHTQSPGLQTWVKQLPVFSHFVTEVQSFNIPVIPQVRLVTEYMDIQEVSVLFDDRDTGTKFAFASTTNGFYLSSSTATSTFNKNQEFAYIQQLFASSSEEMLVFKRQQELEERNRFIFGPAEISTTTLATTTKVWRDVQLAQIDEDIYAQWVGKEKNIPYYFCVNYSEASSTVLYYGQHVQDSLIAEYGTSTTFENALHVTDRVCRTQVRIDRLWQSVQWFDFLPGSRDHVLMHLQDGLYVVEIDDRAWQNTQLLYPGDYLEVLLDNGQIYIKDDEYYLEVYTELQ